MFSGWFKPSAILMEVFERQFGEENGMLVYRRHGKGPAYRVSEIQREALIDQYVRDYRKRSAVMTVAVVLSMIGIIAALLIADVEPDGPVLWWTLGPLLVVIIVWFVWAGHRGALRLESDLARNSPVATALSSVEAKQKALSQVSYVTLATTPLYGFVAVFLGAKYFDVWTGSGRLVWLVPAGLAALAATQAIRKLRLERDRF